MRAARAVALLAGLAASWPVAAAAHGGSYDIKYVDGSNVELVTFNTHTPVAGLAIEHNVRLYDLVGAPVTYEEVTAEIHVREDTSDLVVGNATLLHEETLPLRATNDSVMTFTYPEAGQYTLKLTFLLDGRPISEGEMALPVGRAPAGEESSVGDWLVIVGAMALGGLLVHLVHRYRLRRRGSPI